MILSKCRVCDSKKSGFIKPCSDEKQKRFKLFETKTVLSLS